MSAIAPPPIPGVPDEAYEVRLESKQALVALEASQARAHAHGSAMPQRTRSRLGSLAGIALLGGLLVAAVLAVTKLTRRPRRRSQFTASVRAVSW